MKTVTRLDVFNLDIIMCKNPIYNLRVAIYQTSDIDPKLQELKKKMIQTLGAAERKLLLEYFE